MILTTAVGIAVAIASAIPVATDPPGPRGGDRPSTSSITTGPKQSDAYLYATFTRSGPAVHPAPVLGARWVCGRDRRTITCTLDRISPRHSAFAIYRAGPRRSSVEITVARNPRWRLR